MLDPRVYRAGLVPLLIVVAVVAFSLVDRPRPVRTTLAADAFNEVRAFDGLQDLAERFPERRPGSEGDEALAEEVAGEFDELGFRVRTTTKEGETVAGDQPVANVIAERTGTRDERIVIVAHRDAVWPGSPAELSATAGLLELARVYGAPRRTSRTLTLVSTSGGTGGSAGAARLADELEPVSEIAGVLVLGDLASSEVQSEPLVVPWSNDLGQAPLQLRRTAEEAVRVETGLEPRGPRALAQMARLTLPFTTSGQGALLADGLPAVTLSVRGEQLAPADAPVSAERLGTMGRAALRTLTALDNGPSLAAPATNDVLTARKVLPGWTIQLLAGALLLPILAVVVDAAARARRRREPLLPWVRWTLATALPFAGAALLAVVMARTGLLPAAPGAPTPPAALPLDAAGAVALVATALAFVLGWVGLRPLALRSLRGRGLDRRSPGASIGLMLVLCLALVVIWTLNPFAALVLAPAAHLWLLAVTPDMRLPRPAGLGLLLAGLLPVAALLAYVAVALEVGPLALGWALLLWVSGGHLGVSAVALGTVLAGCAAAVTLITMRQPSRQSGQESDSLASVRGPISYAGPGSLGGTRSALR
ncbi:MAG TPA: hypothetical protein VGW11_11855 [Solirubrobacteraceae bacterium]|nr:hypothetical protein [Solirubrobacteraceae bacterium]